MEGRRQQQKRAHARQVVARDARRKAVQADEQPSEAPLSSDIQWVRSDADSESATCSSAGVSNGRSQGDRLTKQNTSSRQPSEPVASQQMNSAEQEATQLTDDYHQLSPKRAPQRLPDAQLADDLPVGGQLLAFVMPKAAPGTELRLIDDGSHLPIKVTVPQQACMGDVVTGRVYDGRLLVTKIVMGLWGQSWVLSAKADLPQ